MKFPHPYAVVLVLLGVVPFYSSCSTGIRVDAPSSEAAEDCSRLEPSNPYEEGTGHYAGYKWGEEGKSCGGNSTSFIEGCEEYEAQEEAYDACVSKSKE